MQKQEPFLAFFQKKKLNASVNILDFKWDVILGRKIKILFLLQNHRAWKNSFILYKFNMYISVRMPLYIHKYRADVSIAVSLVSWSCCSVTLTLFAAKPIWIYWWNCFGWPSFKVNSRTCDRKVDDRQILWSMILIGNLVVRRFGSKCYDVPFHCNKPLSTSRTDKKHISNTCKLSNSWLKYRFHCINEISPIWNFL